MSLYESMSLLGFEIGTMLANLHIMLMLRAVFNMLMRSPR